MEIGPVGPEHRALLAVFRCAGSARTAPWSIVIENLVRERLADALKHAGTSALGVWGDGQLLAVIAWTIDPAASDSWQVVTLATGYGWYRRGLARRLKLAVLAEARAARAREVVSLVHRDNTAMCALNESLGGRAVLDPSDPRREHLVYVVPVS